MKHPASEKAYKGFGMEGFTARWYASLTCKSLDEFKSLARRVADQIPPGSHVLEVAPRPGYFAIELAKLGGYRVTGLDISHTFVEIAGRNAKQAGVDVDFQQGKNACVHRLTVARARSDVVAAGHRFGRSLGLPPLRTLVSERTG